MIVGSPPSYSGSGTAFVYPGSAGGVLPAPDTTLAAGAQEHDAYGESVSGAGDVDGDGDGFDDVIVGAPSDNASGGRAYLYRGYGAAGCYVDGDGDGFGTTERIESCGSGTSTEDVVGRLVEAPSAQQHPIVDRERGEPGLVQRRRAGAHARPLPAADQERAAVEHDHGAVGVQPRMDVHPGRDALPLRIRVGQGRGSERGVRGETERRKGGQQASTVHVASPDCRFHRER